MSFTRSTRRFGHLLQDAGHQVGVGVHHHDGVAVPARGLLPQLVGDDVVHQGGLAHAGAGHVEVVAAQQVLGEADLPGLPRRGVAHQGAALDALGRGQSALEPERSTRGVSSPLRAGATGQADLADAQDAAPPEQARAGGCRFIGSGTMGLTLPTLNLAPAGWS